MVLTVRMKKCKPRFKHIGDKSQFNEDMILKELSEVPFSLVYRVEDLNEKLDIFHSLLLEAMNHHAPVIKIQMTPPAPWMYDPEILLL